ncbi:hypothetical protein [Xanthomonas hortorum]|uniref:hypothetical protein n=2 Tax=Xanthomonas hortorum TaxID=56454 RepID=UPI001F1E4587|nr:hypothetical protein [Xanthomonas hortorum]MCE4364139.1 hypothetical protein [Xanthomonas hortorum]
MLEINAAQARANSEASTHGADEVVRQVGQFIKAVSQTGETSVTHFLSKKAVSEKELQGAIAELEGGGFKVERVGTTASQNAIKVSW